MKLLNDKARSSRDERLYRGGGKTPKNLFTDNPSTVKFFNWEIESGISPSKL